MNLKNRTNQCHFLLQLDVSLIKRIHRIAISFVL